MGLSNCWIGTSAAAAGDNLRSEASLVQLALGTVVSALSYSLEARTKSRVDTYLHSRGIIDDSSGIRTLRIHRLIGFRWSPYLPGSALYFRHLRVVFVQAVFDSIPRQKSKVPVPTPLACKRQVPMAGNLDDPLLHSGPQNLSIYSHTYLCCGGWKLLRRTLFIMRLHVLPADAICMIQHCTL